jgi:predicted esterase
LVATLLSCSLSISAAYAALTKETIGNHVCDLYVPATVTADKPAPLLMLFHGSGRDGMSQINEWRKLADKEGIVLAAPNATNAQHWNIPDDGPELLRDIVTFVGKKAPIDQRRIYAFGHSAGAVFLLSMAPLESNFLAAVAVHAGAFSTIGTSGILDFADRLIPIFLIIGSKDQDFSVTSVQQTRDALVAAGFPAEMREIAGHDHNYYRRAAEINDMAWAFLAPKHLEEDARYKVYTIFKNGNTVSVVPAKP